MKKLMILASLLTLSSSAFAGTVSRCEGEILKAAQTNIDLKVNAYKIIGYDAKTGEKRYFGGNLDRSTLTEVSVSAKSQTATIMGEDIGSNYQIEVKVGAYCDVESVVIKDLGPK